jgi:hypothetical protein
MRGEEAECERWCARRQPAVPPGGHIVSMRELGLAFGGWWYSPPTIMKSYVEAMVKYVFHLLHASKKLGVSSCV